MLHVTNGESAARVLRATGLDGDIVCWNDVLHEGPVPDVPTDALRSVRAGFLSSQWAAHDQVLRELADRDARLARAAAQDEIVLWFEHDLYDQLQLLEILNRLVEARADWRRVSLVCGDEFVGLSTPERLRERFPQRLPIAESQVALARRAWAAFRAPDPAGIAALLGQDLAALPFLGPALRRHLEQFPSTFNGLSRSEHQGLEAIAEGATSVRDAFVRSQQREEAMFLGDLVFLTYLEELSRGEAPLVTCGSAPDPLDAPVSLTAAGEAVLRGDADRIALNGIDRWLGGVHLEGRKVWRWDGSAIVPGSAQL